MTDPIVSHPQNARAGRWGISREEFEESYKNGDIEPAVISVEVQTITKEV